MKPLSRKALALEASQTLALSARAKKMKAEGIDVISLTAGEPDFPTPQVVKDAAIRAIQENFTKYTQNQGIPELLKAIAAKFERDNNLHFSPAQILVSCGAKHSVYNALQTLCNKGDEVIIPAPFWVSYPEMVRLADGSPVLVRTSFENGFKMTPAQLKRCITKKTKALILNSPCNPTGSVYTQEEIEALGEVVERTGIYVISDEIYEKVIFDGFRHFSIGSIGSIAERVITVNGVSKAFSMTGWRIGFMGAPIKIAETAEKIQSQVTSNASSVSQRAAVAALTQNLDAEIQSMTDEFDRRRKYLTGAFSSIPNVPFVEPKGAFYLFFNVKSYLGRKKNGKVLKNADDLTEYFLTDHRVAMVPGSGFGEKNWIRLSYACSMEELKRGVERIQEGLGTL